jgi:hypothetical protein
MGPVEAGLDDERHAAGAVYLAALRTLGLEPDGLFWAWDRLDERWVLMLVSRYFDIVGPSALSTLLFKAYNAAATPAEIDPFIIRIHSPDHHMIRSMIKGMDDFKSQVIDRGRITKGDSMENALFGNNSILVPLPKAYVWKDVRRPTIDLLRKWGFITKKVDALAA